MKIRIAKSFARDVDRIRDKKLLAKLRDLLSLLEEVQSIREIAQTKKIRGYDSLYRIKIGDYRLGLEEFSGQEVILVRFLHRKEIYRYFPRQ
jgi:mRNA interferase RelE/StbE